MGAPVKEEVIQEYISRWKQAKQRWIDVFDGNTIYTYPTKIECSLNDEDRLEEVERYIRKLKTHNYHYTYGRPAFIEFLRLQGVSAVENVVAYDFRLTDEITIPKGMKLLRAFKYFFTEKDDITQAQDEMNLIISRTKFNGYLHLSVDPLDYLSISENTYGWRSCHSLDGDYAAGNLEYMMDDTTVVCYIDDGTQAKLPNFPDTVLWNNKRWRMLLFFSPDRKLVFASRQYPFTMTDCFPVLRDCISNFFPLISYDIDWTNNYLPDIIDIGAGKRKLELYERHIITRAAGRVFPLSQIYHHGMHFFYDDILHSSYYTKPYYLVGYRHYAPANTVFEPIDVGIEFDSVRCPICGKQCLVRGEGLECDTTDTGRYVCEHCGRRHCTEDEGGWIGDEWWCQSCLDTDAAMCSKCGELFPISDLVFNEETGEYFCNSCLEDE